jgi:large subunit ribosomal protein L17
VEVLQKLFGSVAERFKARPGGYTRVIRVGRRPGDNAEVSLIELVDRAAPVEEEKKKAPEKAERPPEKKEKGEKGAKAEKAEKKTAPKKAKAEKK